MTVYNNLNVKNLSLMTGHHFFFDHLKSQPPWLLLLLSLGLFALLKLTFTTLNWVHLNFTRPGKELLKYGSWAIIAGPTNHIGKAYATHLAKSGFNLILLGRDPDKLKRVSESIKLESGSTEIRTIVADYLGDLNDVVLRVEEAIEGLDIGILVNNVGISYPYARFLHEVDEKLLGDLIKVNVVGPTRVTKVVLKGMVRRTKGVVVFVGSGSAVVIPSDPLYSVYAATKAYVDQFSRCLHVEYKKRGIDVQLQVPLDVETKMASIRRSSFFVPSTDDYARAALRLMGYEPRCTPYWPHSLVWTLVRYLPESFVDSWRIKFSLGIRKRGQLQDSRRKKD